MDDSLKDTSLLGCYESCFENIGYALRVDRNGFISYVSNSFKELNSFVGDDEIVGKNINMFISGISFQRLVKLFLKGILVRKEKAYTHPIDIVTKSGIHFTFLAYAFIDFDKNGKIKGFFFMCEDLSFKKLVVDAALKTGSQLDSSFKNTKALKIDLQNIDYKCFIALIDIANMYEIRNVYGDSVVKKVIKEVTDISADVFKNDFNVYSYDGKIALTKESNLCSFDEFEIDIRNFLELFKNMNLDIDHYNIHLNLVAGISRSQSPTSLSQSESTLSIALKNDKECLIFSDDMHSKWIENIEIIGNIKSAFIEDRFVVYYQPIICNETRKVEKYESLIRLKNKDGQIVPPFLFLEASKKANLYSEITHQVIHQSFKLSNQTQMKFSINLTTLDLDNKNTMRYLRDKLRSMDVSNNLTIEIVESEEITDFESVRNILIDFKNMGIEIAVDDFGTGYSNFNYLLNLGADYVKIDGSLIKDILVDSGSEVIVSTIVGFAKKMGLKTVAEFVSSEEIFEKVKEIGIDYSQGFLFDKPKPKEELVF